MSNELHLDVDPNDPRNNDPAGKLPSLDEVPEAEPTPVAISKVRGENFTQHLGRDPNDPRVKDELEDVSLKADKVKELKPQGLDINNPDHGNKFHEDLQ